MDLDDNYRVIELLICLSMRCRPIRFQSTHACLLPVTTGALIKKKTRKKITTQAPTQMIPNLQLITAKGNFVRLCGFHALRYVNNVIL